jgi:cobaltochelatase CobN
MTASRPTFVVIDSYGGQLTSIGAAAKSLGDRVRVVARSRVDLFDDKRIKACAEEIKAADALVLILMGGIESVPGYADLLDAARGKPVHVHTGSEPPDFIEVIERYGLDFTSDDFRRRQAYLREGGIINLRNLLCLMGRDLGFDMPEPQPPAAVPTEGIYHPAYAGGAKDRDGYLAWARATQGRGPDAPVIGIWLYRSSWLNDDFAVIDALIAEIEAGGAIALAVFHLRYRDVDSGAMSVVEVTEHFFKRDGEAVIDALLSTMGSSMAQASPGSGHVLPDLDVPVLQLILTYNPRADWEGTIQAVTPTDVSTYAAQPEFDGVIIGTVVGTRDDAGVDPVTGARLARRSPVLDRCRHVVAWALNWARLRRTPHAAGGTQGGDPVPPVPAAQRPLGLRRRPRQLCQRQGDPGAAEVGRLPGRARLSGRRDARLRDARPPDQRPPLPAAQADARACGGDHRSRDGAGLARPTRAQDAQGDGGEVGRSAGRDLLLRG